MANSSRNEHPNALPNYQNAVITREKLKGYALNPMHDTGKHHALVFKRALGFDQSNWEILAQRIQEELPYCEAVLKKDFEYGRLFEVIMFIKGPNGHAADVVTAWVIKVGTDFPFLVTTYVNAQ